MIEINEINNKKRTSSLRKSKMRKYKFLYILLLPAIIWTLIFSYVPLGGIVIAFQKYDIIKGITGSPFCSLDNFYQIFNKPAFSTKLLSATLNTLLYSSVVLFLGTPFPIILAILFNELKNTYVKKVAQTLSYLPTFLSWVAVSGMFYSIFATYGIWNDILEMCANFLHLQFERKNIMMDSKNFVHVVFWVNLWKTVGWSSIIYLAAITGINQEMYEAARIDGCSRFKQAIYITIPSIVPTMVILFIMSFGGLLSSNFDLVFTFQNAYIQEKTEIIDTLTYRLGILQGEYSFTMAFGIVKSIISIILTVVCNKVCKKISGVGLW